MSAHAKCLHHLRGEVVPRSALDDMLLKSCSIREPTRRHELKSGGRVIRKSGAKSTGSNCPESQKVFRGAPSRDSSAHQPKSASLAWQPDVASAGNLAEMQGCWQAPARALTQDATEIKRVLEATAMGL